MFYVILNKFGYGSTRLTIISGDYIIKTMITAKKLEFNCKTKALYEKTGFMFYTAYII